MTDPATAHRTPHLIPLGEAMTGVLVTVQLLPPGPQPDRTQDAVRDRKPPEPPPRAEAR